MTDIPRSYDAKGEGICHQCRGTKVSNSQACAACGGRGSIPPAGSADRFALDAGTD